MTTLPVHTFVQHELRRLKHWLSGTTESLDSVETARTVSDCVDCDRLGRRLPDGWCVDREIVQFPGESLTEVVRLTDGERFRITLKPVELCAPTDRIEVYTRVSPSASRRHRRTVDSLSEAVIYATGIAARRQPRRQWSTETPAGRQ